MASMVIQTAASRMMVVVAARRKGKEPPRCIRGSSLRRADCQASQYSTKTSPKKPSRPRVRL
jgi:hypothetical protein